MVKINCENIETVAHLNFLRDMAGKKRWNLIEDDDPVYWNDLPQDEKDLYIKEAEQTLEDYVLTLEEVLVIEKCCKFR